MSRARIVRKSFNAGEITPELHFRSDIEQYHSACKRLHNMIVTPWGAVERRGPSELLAKIDEEEYGIPLRILPFRFSLSEIFHIVFTAFPLKLEQFTIEADGIMDDDFRLVQKTPSGDVVLYDDQLNMTWYEGETQTWDPDTQTGTRSKNAFPFDSPSNYEARKITLTAAQILAAGGNLIDPVQVFLVDTHGQGMRFSTWTVTLNFEGGLTEVRTGGRNSGIIASEPPASGWPFQEWSPSNITNGALRNPEGVNAYENGEFGILEFEANGHMILFDDKGEQQVVEGASGKILATPYNAADLVNLHFVNVNDFFYLTCGGDYPVQLLQRYFDEDQDANRWKIEEWEHIGGPFNDQNQDENHVISLDFEDYDSGKEYSLGDVVIVRGGDSFAITAARWDFVSSRYVGRGFGRYQEGTYRLSLTTSTAHGLSNQDVVRIRGVSGSGGSGPNNTIRNGNYDGVYSVVAVISSTQVRLSLGGTMRVNNGTLPTLALNSAVLTDGAAETKIYLSLQDANQDNTPPASGETAFWREVFYASGQVPLTSNRELFDESDVGRELRVRNSYDDRYPMNEKWTANAVSRVYALQGTIRLKTEGGSWGGTLLLEESTDLGNTWKELARIESKDGSTNASLERELIGVRSLVRVRLINYSAVSGASVPACIWFLTALNPYYNFFRITEVIDGNKAIAQAVSPLVPVDIRSDYRWSLGAFGERPGYPRTIAIHEERMIYGGTKEKPNTVWASRVNDWRNFFEGDLDVSPYTFTIKADSFDVIRWIRSARALMIGTEVSESTIAAPDSARPISPTNVEVKTHTHFGSGNLQALVTADLVFFVQGQNRRVRSTQYDFASDQYLSSELSILANHITAPGIKEMNFQRNPWSVIWFTLIDGRAVTFTYERDNRVQGWATLELGGGGEIISAAGNYSTEGDLVGLIVRRESGWYLEQIRGGDIYLDAQHRTEGVDYQNGQTLPYEYGEGAVVVHNGRVLGVDEYTLAGTSLTIPGVTGGTVAIGYPYQFIVEPTDIIELGDFGTFKRSSKLGLYLLNSGGCKVEINGKESAFQAWQSAGPGELLDGEYQIPVGGGHASSIGMRFSGNHPYPFRLAAVGIFGAPSQ